MLCAWLKVRLASHHAFRYSACYAGFDASFIQSELSA
jgi:hypothetical protein